MSIFTNVVMKCVSTVILCLTFAASASADKYPAKAITWIVPSAPGGVTDTSSRIIAKALSAKLGVPVLVDPRPGAGGTIATEAVANAKPDGYTMLHATSGTIATNPWLYKKLSYDPIKSFKPVVAMISGSSFLVVPNDSPFRTLADLISYDKANPGKINFGSAGPGTGQHLAMELLKNTAGIDVTHVPFKGATPAQTALLSSTIDAAFDYYSSVNANLEARKLRALIYMGDERTKTLPTVPTLKESGYDVSFAGWSSVVVPAATPDAVAATLADAVIAALDTPETAAYLESMGSQRLRPMRGEELTAFHRTEMERIRTLVEQSGAAAQ